MRYVAVLLNPGIRPLWRNTETFEHRFVGTAVSALDVPTNKRHEDEPGGVQAGGIGVLSGALARAGFPPSARSEELLLTETLT